MSEYLNSILSEDTVSYLEEIIGNWGFYISIAVLLLEFGVYAIKKKFTLQLLGDSVTNFVTLFMFFFIAAIVFTAYLAGFYWLYLNFSITQLPINGWTIIACILLADIAYYWEHRFMHRTGVGWATHTVHHSSPHFNISVAYRFGPLDGVMPFFFSAPMAILGFNPIVILFSEAFVQIYQTLLHTEVVKKLPRPIEAIFNTPSHHRVHHGSNPEYIDKNYAGIFIIWDKIFGTFEEEKAPVRYGLTKPINTINPLKVFFIGFGRLFQKSYNAKGFKNKFLYWIKPPGWEPEVSQNN